MKKILLILSPLLLVVIVATIGGGAMIFFSKPQEKKIEAPTGYTISEARENAENHILEMQEYKEFEGDNLTLKRSSTVKCEFCWSFTYEFEPGTQEVVEKPKITVLIKDGEIEEAVFDQGGLIIKTEKELLDDQIVEFLEDLKIETQILFSQASDSDLIWFESEDEKIVINAKKMLIENSSKKEETIASYFKDVKFSIDEINSSQSIISNLTGYKKNDIVCSIHSTLDDDGIEKNRYSIMVKCGSIKSLKEEQSSEAVGDLKKLFAEKFDIKVEDVNILIKTETQTHIRGEVKSGEEGDTKTFLGFKEDDLWNVVHEGSGVIMCTEIAKYEFPKDMISDCVDIDIN